MNEYAISQIPFTTVDYTEGKFRVHGIVYNFDMGGVLGVFILDTIYVVANYTLYELLDNGTCLRICDADENTKFYSDAIRAYIWNGNIYTSLRNNTISTKYIDEYPQKTFGPWYFINGLWKHVMTNKTIFGGHDAEYVTFSHIETVQVNNAIVGDAFIKLSNALDRKRIVDLCRRYINDNDDISMVRGFAAEIESVL